MARLKHYAGIGVLSLILASTLGLRGAIPFDAAPFALPLPEGNGLLWEDPREIHQVVVQFEGAAPSPEQVRLEYWGSRWPQQRLPKDREPGGGDVGWMELGNWHQGGWRKADTEVKTEGPNLVFSFRPLSAKEFPALKDYPATFRFTLKLRVRCDSATPHIRRLQAFTDSVYQERGARLAWKELPAPDLEAEAFNGSVRALRHTSAREHDLSVDMTINPDPNTFDRTLVTVRSGTNAFTFRVDDLAAGALLLPQFDVAVLPGDDRREYAEVARDIEAKHAKTLYDRVAEMPEQTWRSALGRHAAQEIAYRLPARPGRRAAALSAGSGRRRQRSGPTISTCKPGRARRHRRLKLEAPECASVSAAHGRPVTAPSKRRACRLAIPLGDERCAHLPDRLRYRTQRRESGRAGPRAGHARGVSGEFVFTNITASPHDYDACR